MTDPADWHTWLALNPPPSLQELVAKYGGYDKIPALEWERFDLARTQWESARRDRLLGSQNWRLFEAKHKR
jgi:hypothetical protein